MDGEKFKVGELHQVGCCAIELVSFVNSTTDIWDTAGQERFARYVATLMIWVHHLNSNVSSSAACIPPITSGHMLASWSVALLNKRQVVFVLPPLQAFDVTRKVTYQNLSKWYKELRLHCENVPVILVANKIDINYEVTKKKFKFPEKHGLPFYFVSAADGSNVVKVGERALFLLFSSVCMTVNVAQTFKEAISLGVKYKREGGDFLEEVMELLQDVSTGDHSPPLQLVLHQLCSEYTG